ncbi:unnamed protein product [Gadus morhua 'NCC']
MGSRGSVMREELLGEGFTFRCEMREISTDKQHGIAVKDKRRGSELGQHAGCSSKTGFRLLRRWSHGNEEHVRVGGGCVVAGPLHHRLRREPLFRRLSGGQASYTAFAPSEAISPPGAPAEYLSTRRPGNHRTQI